MIDLHINRAYYGTAEVPALNGLDLNLSRGEVVAVLGKSGCGKSTLLNIIASLHKGYDGRLDMPENAAIGYIPQNKCLLPWKTAAENIMLLGRLKNPPDYAKAESILERLGIAALKNKFPGRLSGGEYQRVRLGQTLYYEPQVLLMDEPFSALDEETKADILALFLKLQQERGITTVFVTHDSREAEAIGSKIVRLLA